MNRVENTLANIDSQVTAVVDAIAQLGEAIMTVQDTINAVAAELTQENSDLNTALTALQAWIAAQPASVDVSALQPIADALKTSVASVAALVPAPPAPTPPAGG
jgi:septal ring factor EnvC (AmiA/AmiB activator)